VAVINILLGTVYVTLGLLIVVDLKLGWHVFGFSRFGGGLAAVAFTCGAHHLAHGHHVVFEGHDAGALDLVSVVVGLPFALTWLSLRLEALAGGVGDRIVRGSPAWVLAAPTVAAAYLTALAAAGVILLRGHRALPLALLPQVLLVVVYVRVGWMLLRTQLLFHDESAGWSVSGCAMAGIFFTCAVMHAVLVLYGVAGRQVLDGHEFVIACLGVPAGVYFLSVVRGLVRDEISDWNVVPDLEPDASRPA
jgi:hypothetical protein